MSASAQGTVSVKEIAEKEGLSNAYVEKLLRLLAKSELVHSQRGLKGGYRLSKAPEAITLAEVVRALGRLETTEHICGAYTGHKEICVHYEDCGIRSVWSGLTDYVHGFLHQTTLASIMATEQTVTARLAQQTPTIISFKEEKTQQG